MMTHVLKITVNVAIVGHDVYRRVLSLFKKVKRNESAESVFVFHEYLEQRAGGY